MKLDIYLNNGGIGMNSMAELFTTSLFGMFSEKRKYEKEKESKEHEDWLKAREKYRESVTEIRYGDFCDLEIMVNTINNYINNNGDDNFDKDQASIIKELIEKIDIPNEKLHPYEIPIMFDFKILQNRLEKIINS